MILELGETQVIVTDESSGDVRLSFVLTSVIFNSNVSRYAS